MTSRSVSEDRRNDSHGLNIGYLINAVRGQRSLGKHLVLLSCRSNSILKVSKVSTIYFCVFVVQLNLPRPTCLKNNPGNDRLYCNLPSYLQLTFASTQLS
jgi:hypothetical protein